MLVALCLCEKKLQPYAEPTIASQAVSLKKENSTPKSSSPCTGFVAGQLERALVIHQGVKALDAPPGYPRALGGVPLARSLAKGRSTSDAYMPRLEVHAAVRAPGDRLGAGSGRDRGG